MSIDDLYRRVIMDHYKHPRNKGELESQTVTATLNNPSCGDTISLQMIVKDGKIEDAKFRGEGCSISLASASMMTEAIKGRDAVSSLKLVDLFSQMMQGKAIDIDDFGLEDIESLSGVTKFPARIKCATLAWKALEQSLSKDCTNKEVINYE